MGAYSKTLTLVLAAAVIDGVCLSQSAAGAGNLTINGSLAASGAVTFDVPRRVLITFAGDETGHNFTITGTGRNGLAQTEVIAGTTGSAYTVKDFATVTQVAVSAATTSTVRVGTNDVAGSTVYIVDRFIDPANLTVGVEVTGTVNYSIQVAYIDLAPAWDLNSNTVTWFAPSNTTTLTSKTANANDQIVGPVTMIRILQNSGTGTTVARILSPMGFVG